MRPRSVRNYVAEIERIESEIAEFNSDKSEIYKSAKDAAVDVKALRDVIAYRRKRAKHGVSKLEAEDEKFAEYLGLIEGGTLDATRARTRLNPATGEVNEDRTADAPAEETTQPVSVADATAGTNQHQRTPRRHSPRGWANPTITNTGFAEDGMTVVAQYARKESDLSDKPWATGIATPLPGDVRAIWEQRPSI